MLAAQQQQLRNVQMNSQMGMNMNQQYLLQQQQMAQNQLNQLMFTYQQMAQNVNVNQQQYQQMNQFNDITNIQQQNINNAITTGQYNSCSIC